MVLNRWKLWGKSIVCWLNSFQIRWPRQMNLAHFNTINHIIWPICRLLRSSQCRNETIISDETLSLSIFMCNSNKAHFPFLLNRVINWAVIGFISSDKYVESDESSVYFFLRAKSYLNKGLKEWFFDRTLRKRTIFKNDF